MYFLQAFENMGYFIVLVPIGCFNFSRVIFVCVNFVEIFVSNGIEKHLEALDFFGRPLWAFFRVNLIKEIWHKKKEARCVAVPENVLKECYFFVPDALPPVKIIFH